ncbi:MAG: hypothetical protein ACLP4V_17460 [Methylocella sp.]
MSAFNAVIEVWALGRQDEQLEASRLAFVLEHGFELAVAIDLNAADGERRFGDELVEEGFGARRAGLQGDAADRPFGDRVVGREVLDRLVGADVDEQRVDLDELPRGLGFAAFRQAAGAVYHWARTAVQHDQRSRVKYAALRARGHGHGRALRSIADRLLAVACAMLETRTIFDPNLPPKRTSAAT